MRRVVGIGLLLCAAGVVQAAPPLAASSADACAGLLPRSLLEEIKTEYPASRLGTSQDYAPEDLAEFKVQGQSCPAVDAADVTGSGRDSYAFLLVTNAQDVVLLAAIHNGHQHWKLQLLMDWGDSVVSDLYVSSIDAGKYEDLDAGDKPPSAYEPEPGRVKKFTAARPGFISGKIDSSGAAFFYSEQHWVHLWLSG